MNADRPATTRSNATRRTFSPTGRLRGRQPGGAGGIASTRSRSTSAAARTTSSGGAVIRAHGSWPCSCSLLTGAPPAAADDLNTGAPGPDHGGPVKELTRANGSSSSRSTRARARLRARPPGARRAERAFHFTVETPVRGVLGDPGQGSRGDERGRFAADGGSFWSDESRRQVKDRGLQHAAANPV